MGTRRDSGAVVAVDFRSRTRIDNQGSDVAPSERHGPASFAATLADGEGVDEMKTKQGLGFSIAEGLVGKTMVPRNYRIIELIGEGGMGAVFKAQEPTIGATFALKLLSKNPGDIKPEMLRRIEEEGRRMAMLNHPNIVKVTETFTNEFGTFLVMEYVPGQSLDQLIEQRGKLPLEFVQDVMEQILMAVEACHRAGIIHRDLKPENVMIQDGGRPHVKVTDFGIAKIVDPTGGKVEKGLTTAGTRFGTPEYMAPELWVGQAASEQSDIYSLGVVIYRMFCGRPPFPLDEVEGKVGIADVCGAVMGKHLSDPIPDPKLFRPELPPALVAVVLKALAKKPEERFPNVAVMRQAIADAFAEAGLNLPRRSMLSATNHTRMSDPHSATLYPDGSLPMMPRKQIRGMNGYVIALTVIALIGIGSAFVVPRLMRQTRQNPAFAPAVSAVASIAPPPASSAAPLAVATEPELTAAQQKQMDECLKKPFKSNPTCAKFCKACDGMPSRHIFCRSSCKFAGLEK